MVSVEQEWVRVLIFIHQKRKQHFNSLSFCICNTKLCLDRSIFLKISYFSVQGPKRIKIDLGKRFFKFR